MVDVYQDFMRPLLFQGLKTDPEWLHVRALEALAWLAPGHGDDSRPTGREPIQRWLTQQTHYSDPRLAQTLWHCDFANPLGLAAGFDKDGTAALAWPLLGFGLAELGTVTLHPQPGNPRPRLFRLPADQAVLNRMGFNNGGAAALAARLQRYWSQHPPVIPMGINLGKSKITPLDQAVADYVSSFKLLRDWGQYFVVNVSSPNTPGLRSLQTQAQLSPILAALQAENPEGKPLLVKIAPDLEWEEIAAIADLAMEHQLAGIIATNTTIQRQGLQTQFVQATGQPMTSEAGGISGAPLRQRATEVVRFLYRHSQGRLPIVGVGGIFTAEDAWERITAGASLLQVYTGWVYGGPMMVRRILEGLAAQLDAHGLDCIADAVGIESDR
ncbi:MAG: quinone-dependent dihydroorotate dehydrogenase [Cyanobacteria bacterium]|nr:quinone-dependent dihydroorotate dehydrogenase [Cyanobacteriota bacterium]MDA0867579.1 quinone-dependent dihydroorotate dehydrogenase [Cyanobacteriota bacterium]